MFVHLEWEPGSLRGYVGFLPDEGVVVHLLCDVCICMFLDFFSFL